MITSYTINKYGNTYIVYGDDTCHPALYPYILDLYVSQSDPTSDISFSSVDLFKKVSFVVIVVAVVVQFQQVYLKHQIKS